MLLIIVLSIFVLLTILGMYFSDEKMSIIGATIYFVLFGISLCFAIRDYSNCNNTKHYDVQLPEEYQATSNIPCKPDTFVGFIRNDSLILSFK